MRQVWDNIRRIDDAVQNVAKFVFSNGNAVAESVLYKYPDYATRTTCPPEHRSRPAHRSHPSRRPTCCVDLPIPQRLDIDQIVEHSFKDLHVKGFDYLCLKRSPEETIKLYFFDGDVSKMPEVVAPHDHRYDFETYVAAGAIENVWFRRSHNEELGEVFNWFEYRTPLNGGDGFTLVGEEILYEANRYRFSNGESYYMQADDLHTIRIAGNETVLMLVQFEDFRPIEKSTSTFFKGNALSLDGLYNKFTADEVIAKLRHFEARTGITFRKTWIRDAA